jgi:RNA polymerase sigma factor (sigma-70 family)
MRHAPTCSDPELLSLCGRGEDASAWDEFVERFNRRIVVFVIRERRSRGLVHGADEAEVVSDLTQEVYLRLLANDRRALRNFRGDSDIAVVAYLARVVRAVVGDHLRRERSQKRSARLVSITEPPDGEGAAVGETLEADAAAAPDRLMSERLLAERVRLLLTSSGGANAARDAMIFQLHVLEGLTAREIAAIPSLEMSLAAVETVLHRTRDRLRSIIGGPSDLSV